MESSECQSLLTMTLFSVSTLKKYQVMFLGNQASEPPDEIFRIYVGIEAVCDDKADFEMIDSICGYYHFL